MKKILFTLLACAACLACSNDDNPAPEPTIDPYEFELPVGVPLPTRGTSTVTGPDGSIFVDDQAEFEFTALDATHLRIDLHKARFASAMPGIEMRIPSVAFEADEKQLGFVFAASRIVPEANVAETGYKPYERYAITGLQGLLSYKCRVSFTCMGQFQVVYEGELVE